VSGTHIADNSAPARISRRNVLKILAATAALPAGVLLLRGRAAAPAPVQWHGETLGARASLTLWHSDPGVARRTIARMRTEIERLEGVFSLYRSDSEISRLNRNGALPRPSGDLLTVLDESRRIAEVSGGAFDPTVQPLWNVYAGAGAAVATGGPDPAILAEARALTDFTAIDAGPRAIGFGKARMAITLNGIAQGYITDRITDLLRNEGFEQAMVELGETRALGAAPGGQPFNVGLMNPAAPGIVDRAVTLADEALSVSGGYGMRFGGDAHHIFDPATGRSANRLLDVAVVAPRAIHADALSTAIFVAGEQRASDILRAYPPARAMITRSDGSTATL